MGTLEQRCVSALGALVLLGVAYALCPRALRRRVELRTVGGGFGLLLLFAVLVLKTPLRAAFAWANAAVGRMISFSNEGAAFVFGALVRDTKSFGFVFAFQVLPSIVFFAALMSALYYLGLMPFLVRKLGSLLARSLRTSGAESFSTVSDIFVGQTEAPLVIRPYLAGLTESELMACMVAGFATTGGGVLAAYVLMLEQQVPDIAGHLIACSVMCAPASLVIAKLMRPESEAPATLGASPAAAPSSASGLVDAIATGTTEGLRLAANVGAMMISFLALTALVNYCLGALGQLVFAYPLSLELLLGWLFAPVALLLGIPGEDVAKVASLLGQKTVMNEFVAYSQLSEALAKDPHWLSERSRVIVAYALCGFANFGSIGVQIGGYGALAPERRADLARLGPRAMLGGFLTTCLVACVAGALL
ncbi:MAG TPA: nucleoside transporter C-terminal domain-containing protein [Polyangiales bacterium]